MSGLTRDDPSHHVQALVQVHADLGGIDDLGWNHRLPTLVPLGHLRNNETVRSNFNMANDYQDPIVNIGAIKKSRNRVPSEKHVGCQILKVGR